MHAINMAFKKLLNLSTSSELYEAVTKEYVDQRPHIIAVHTNYHSDLHKDEYQFAFGRGAIDPNGSTGFLVPHSGRTKKIQVKITYKGKKHLCNFFQSGFIFTIVALKDMGEVSNILAYECYLPSLKYEVGVICHRECRFNPDPENIPISVGDVINIRSETNYMLISGGRDIPISYLFTFLLELDPL